MCPHKLMFGRRPNIPGILQKEPHNYQKTYDNYIKEFQFHLQSNYEIAKNSIKGRKVHSREYHDKNINVPLFSAEDKVLLHDEKVKRGRSLKLSVMDRSLQSCGSHTEITNPHKLKPFFG
jgi:hypothetical protein